MGGTGEKTSRHQDDPEKLTQGGGRAWTAVTVRAFPARLRPEARCRRYARVAQLGGAVGPHGHLRSEPSMALPDVHRVRVLPGKCRLILVCLCDSLLLCLFFFFAWFLHVCFFASCFVYLCAWFLFSLFACFLRVRLLFSCLLLVSLLRLVVCLVLTSCVTFVLCLVSCVCLLRYLLLATVIFFGLYICIFVSCGVLLN